MTAHPATHPAAACPLVVDPVAHASEIERFWVKVVKGPEVSDCWLWIGAIADDAYGRFWLDRGAGQRVVRPHRYAVALVLGVALGEDDVVEHVRCDNPICVRADPDPRIGHVWPSTQAANLQRMGERGRGGGDWIRRRFSTADRTRRRAWSLAQRDAVRGGWDAELLTAARDAAQGPDRLF